MAQENTQQLKLNQRRLEKKLDDTSEFFKTLFKETRQLNDKVDILLESIEKKPDNQTSR